MSKLLLDAFQLDKIMRRSVAIRTTPGGYCLLTAILEQGRNNHGRRSGIRTSSGPLYAETIKQAIGVAHRFLSGSMNALDECREAEHHEITDNSDPSRNVWIDSARNGWIAKLSCNDEKGRVEAWGDAVVSCDLDEIELFCMGYLNNQHGYNWWDDPDCFVSITRRKGMVEISVNQESIGQEGVIVEPIDYPQCWWDRVSSGDLRWAAPSALSRIIEDDHLNSVVVSREVADEIKSWCENVEGWEYEPGKTCLVFKNVIEED